MNVLYSLNLGFKDHDEKQNNWVLSRRVTTGYENDKNNCTELYGLTRM